MVYWKRKQMRKSIDPKTRRNSVKETIEVNKQKSPEIIELLIVNLPNENFDNNSINNNDDRIVFRTMEQSIIDHIVQMEILTIKKWIK
mgnify:CR=1 FL=1